MKNEITIDSDKCTKAELHSLVQRNIDKTVAISNWKKMEELLETIKETQPINGGSCEKEHRYISAYIKDAQEKTSTLPTYILK